MGVKVATGYLNWSHSSISRSLSSSALASAISSPSSKRRSLTDVSFVCRYVHRSSVFGKKLNRSRSCETLKISRGQIVNANFDSECSDEEFSREIHELALRFQLSGDKDTDSFGDHDVSESEPENFNKFSGEVTNWSGDMIPASIERKANSMDLPFSLRIIQKKKQWEEGFKEAGEFAYCSMKKAFSSMVFIIQELQTYTLQMREVLFFEDLQEILIRVQKEMNASFVWLFQQVFSHTPNLMVYVMILLANYSVHSMSNHVAIAAPPPPATVESVSTAVDQPSTNFDSATLNTYSVNSGTKTTSIGGINGGGGKFRQVSAGTDGDGKFNEYVNHQSIVPDGSSPSTVNPTSIGEESVEEAVSGELGEVDEGGLWDSVVAEGEMMQVTGVEGIDRETMGRFVSPVTVEMEEEIGMEDYLKTELFYQTGLLREPDNPLLLANYAWFLYLFSRDHKRAEEYFKKALEIEPKDPEALSKYAIFLWRAKNDLWGAEEAFLEAISVALGNSYYSGVYAHFLWSNGGYETCFPLE